MSDELLALEPTLRSFAFFGIFLAMVVAENAFPKRIRESKRLTRWPVNLGLTVLNTLFLRVTLPVLAIEAALIAEQNNIGLLYYLELDAVTAAIVAFVALDLMIYFQHVVMHRVPVLWRLHRVHHTDQDFDATTALRFHPIEILFSMGIKIGFIFLIGAPAAAVLLFEIFLNGMAMFNHANLNLPKPVDNFLRMVVVTPDMHRIHHSTDSHEHNMNFGFNFSLWDRLFKTYLRDPRLGHGAMTLGLTSTQHLDVQNFFLLLALPFRQTESQSDENLD